MQQKCRKKSTKNLKEKIRQGGVDDFLRESSLFYLAHHPVVVTSKENADLKILNFLALYCHNFLIFNYNYRILTDKQLCNNCIQ
jgi:hypothetical protein